MSDLQKLAKSFTQREGNLQPRAATSKFSLAKYVPEFILKSPVGNLSKKQWMDITLFGTGIFLIYNYGDEISNKIDQLMPNEAQMQKMLEEMQNNPQMGMGGPPGPM